MESQSTLKREMMAQLLLLRYQNKIQTQMCQALEKTALYGSLENFKEEKVRDYQKLKKKEVSQQQEKFLEEQISKKLGGIDAILSKAAMVNPSLFSNESQSAQQQTQQVVDSLKEEHKESVEQSEKPESLIKETLLPGIAPHRHQSAAGLIKTLLKKTRTEVKAQERAKEATKSKAMRKISSLKATKRSSECLIPQVRQLAGQKLRQGLVQTQANKYNKIYKQAINSGDQVTAFKSYYALWVLDKKGGISPQGQVQQQLSLIFNQTFAAGQQVHPVILTQNSADTLQTKLGNFIRQFHSLTPELEPSSPLNIFDLMIKLEEDEELDTQRQIKILTKKLQIDIKQKKLKTIQTVLASPQLWQNKSQIETLRLLKALIYIVGVRGQKKLQRKLLVASQQDQ